MYQVSSFADDFLLFVSLCSRFCLYICPRKENWKGEKGLEGEEDEEVAPAWPNPKMVSRERRGEFRLFCLGDNVREEELVVLWREEGRVRMLLFKALGERLRDIFKFSFGSNVRSSPRN
jgi:hypothetical protein